MNTPPPEESLIPMPYSSMSTPFHPVQHPVEKRPRRHTITQPDPELEHLPEAFSGEDETEAFERISDILSSLLQEANAAINGFADNEHPVTILDDDSDDGDDEYSEVEPIQSISRPPISRCPRSNHTWDSSISSTLSSSTTVISCSIDTPASSSVLTPPLTPKSPASLAQKIKTRRPLSCPMIPQPPTSMYIISPKRSSALQQVESATTSLRDPLSESYKRLNQSMAALDSLSRDFIPQAEGQNDTSPCFSNRSSSRTPIPSSSALNRAFVKLDFRLALFILPFLHIPHTFISMIYDTLLSNDPNNLPGTLAWCILYCLASLAMDHTVVAHYSKTQKQQQRRRPLSVPGSYAPIDLIPPPINTQPTIVYPRRSNRRLVVLPRRTSLYRKLQSQQQSLRQLSLKPSSSSLAITRTKTQPGYYMPTTSSYGTPPPTPSIFVRRNSF